MVNAAYKLQPTKFFGGDVPTLDDGLSSDRVGLSRDSLDSGNVPKTTPAGVQDLCRMIGAMPSPKEPGIVMDCPG